MSFIGTDLFGLDDKPVYPSAYDYYRSPSLENARAFLEAAGLYVPYEATRTAARLAEEATASLGRRGPGASRGGGKRPRTRTSPAASASPPPAPAPAFASEPSDAASIFHRADFIHDIHTDAVVDELVADMVFTKDVRIPTELRRRLREHCNGAHASVYTRKALETLEGYFGLAARTLSVSNIGSRAAASAIPRDQIIADAYMRNTVTGWMKSNDRGVAELVFDGILDEPIGRPAREGIHQEMHLRSLATCAFLQWMIGGWPGPYGAEAGPSNFPRDIRFLTGTFQTLDVAMQSAFLDRWVGHLKREAPSLKSVRSIQIVWLSADATRGVSSSGGAREVAMAPGEDSALIVRGRRVPFVAPKLTRESEDAFGKLLETSAARQVTYAKRDLTDMFRYYIRLNDAQREDPRVETAVAQVLAVNAFRDAFKADVALARGAVYLTVDRLALVYYEMRRRELGAANRGLAMTIMDNHTAGASMTLKAYNV